MRYFPCGGITLGGVSGAVFIQSNRLTFPYISCTIVKKFISLSSSDFLQTWKGGLNAAGLIFCTTQVFYHPEQLPDIGHYSGAFWVHVTDTIYI
jgi:hypothetical protein